MNPNDTLLVLITCPASAADSLARALVEQRLAACVNALAGVRSTYHWQGQIEQGDEVLLLAKTSSERYEALQAAICQLHPYELPEVIAVPLSRGLPAYLRWVGESVS